MWILAASWCLTGYFLWNICKAMYGNYRAMQVADSTN